MIIKKEVSISCYQLKRTLHIYVPNNYTKSKRRYPVMYMFDGHNLFYDRDATYHKSWGLKDYLDMHKVPMIIVGIECNHEGNKRLEEFSPYDFHDDDVGSIHGSGKQFLKWIVDELKPYIDAHYRTKKGRQNTAIAGSSMGGLMALYGCMQYNHVFSKAACLSCYLDEVFDDLSKEHYSMDPTTAIYLSWGSDEVNTKDELALLSSRNLTIANQLVKQNVSVLTNLVVKGTHSEASWEKEIPTFMKFLFPRQLF